MDSTHSPHNYFEHSIKKTFCFPLSYNVPEIDVLFIKMPFFVSKMSILAPYPVIILNAD